MEPTNSQLITEYAPLVLVIIGYLINYRIFCTPEQLEKKHREILKDIEDKYVTRNEMTSLTESVSDIKEKTDKIYDFILTNYAQQQHTVDK